MVDVIIDVLLINLVRMLKMIFGIMLNMVVDVLLVVFDCILLWTDLALFDERECLESELRVL